MEFAAVWYIDVEVNVLNGVSIVVLGVVLVALRVAFEKDYSRSEHDEASLEQ